MRVADHPLLDLGVFESVFPDELGSLGTPAWLAELLRPGSEAPLATGDVVRKAVRDLLRHAGFKPTGRSKPSPEYLLRAAGDGSLGSINLAVDLGNAVSLHSGLPISVVDLDRVVGPLRVDVAPEGARYVFNPTGQEIDAGKLVCLFDAEGPCANAIKDAQRTKTTGGTMRTLSVVWGTRALEGRTAAAVQWYRAAAARCGAQTREHAGREPGTGPARARSP